MRTLVLRPLMNQDILLYTLLLKGPVVDTLYLLCIIDSTFCVHGPFTLFCAVT